jgi:hypothetical protein
MRYVGVMLVSALSCVISVSAQSIQSNTDHAVELMANTADSVLKANGIKIVKLDAAYAAPVRFKLLQKLLDLGYTVYDTTADVTDVTAMNIDPLLTYRFTAGGNNESIRSVMGTIGVSLTRTDGSIVATHVNRINIKQPVSAKSTDLDDGTWSMVAFASVDNGGRRISIKRILEPALIVTTAAVTIFLLFNVRSQ